MENLYLDCQILPKQDRTVQNLWDKGTTGQAQNLAKGPRRDVGRDRVLIFCHGTGQDGILTACPIPEYPGTEKFVSGFSLLLLFWDKGTVGQENVFCPGTKGQWDK